MIAYNSLLGQRTIQLVEINYNRGTELKERRPRQITMDTQS